METKNLKILAICASPSDATYFTKTISEALPGTEVYTACGFIFNSSLKQ